ncbi:MAG: CoA pyrophosphatase [Bacteroidales bacterium]|jgi:8-oxo-dGTP pyrophosphatase MutT (NUDIX family)|nr:CoA pyrophosphatase [Bacteroidales bacterium]MDD4213735.1 CoA pyrophosphatase [Bacteroidales bacterium]
MQNLTKIIEFLKQRLQKELPGISAHSKMIPQVRHLEFFPVPETARKSSVLFLLFKKNSKICTLIIKRPPYNGVHSSQISFPGGSFQKTDILLKNTALREAEEEIGINKKHVEIIGSLTELYIPPSNFLVKPFIGYTKYSENFIPDKREVEKIIITEIDKFMDVKNLKTKKIKIQSGLDFETPYYDICGETVWGATAMIFSEFTEIMKEYVGTLFKK